MAGERLVEAMQHAASGQIDRCTPTDFAYGTVVSVSPLVIQPEGKKPLDAGFLILSAMCKPFMTTLLRHTHLQENGTGQVTDTQLDPVMVWRGLEVGDRVRMLQCQGGQKYYVLDREEGLL